MDASGQPRPVTLKVAVDEQTNSLLINSTQSLYDEINEVVLKLDAAAKNNAKTYQMVQLNNIDPTVAQQIVDALQGRTTALPASGGSSTLVGTGAGLPGGGFQPGGGFPGGGFQPGGGVPGGGFPAEASRDKGQEEDAAASGPRIAKDEGRIFLTAGSWMTLSRSSSTRNMTTRP